MKPQIKTHKEILKEKAKVSAKKFTTELKRAINTAVMAAFGFLIALVWKDVITGYVDSISKASPVQGKLFSALLVTMICVFGILIITRITREKTEIKLSE
jgi:hypothetical protein